MEYHILIGGTQQGPFSEEELRGKLKQGDIGPDELIWHEGLSEWQPLESLVTIDEQPGESPSPPPLPPTKASWLHKPKVIALLIAVSTVVFFPIAIALVWLSRAFRVRTKIALTFVTPLIAFVLLAILVGGIQQRGFARDREEIISKTRMALASGDTTTLAKTLVNYGMVTDAEFRPLLAQARKMVGESEAATARIQAAANAKSEGETLLESKLRKHFGERLQRFSANEIYSMPGKYNVEVRFTGRVSKNLIERDMAEAYRIVYQTGSIAVHEAWMFAYMPLNDKYGQTTDELVYKTSLLSSEASNINWDQMRLVNFPAVWNQHFLISNL